MELVNTVEIVKRLIELDNGTPQKLQGLLITRYQSINHSINQNTFMQRRAMCMPIVDRSELTQHIGYILMYNARMKSTTYKCKN